MKKIKKSSAFGLIAKARNEKKKRASEKDEETKDKAENVKYGSKSKAQTDTYAILSKNYISINEGTESDEKGLKPGKGVLKAQERDASVSSDNKNLSGKGRKFIEESVIDVDAIPEEVIEILDEDPESPTSQVSCKLRKTWSRKADTTTDKNEEVNLVEIESDNDLKQDDYIDLSQSKKRKKKRKESSRKRERKSSRNDEVEADKSSIDELVNLVEPDTHLMAEEDRFDLILVIVMS